MSISWESIKKFEDIKLERGQNNAVPFCYQQNIS